MTHEIKRGHLLTMKYKGHGEYTVAWKDWEKKTNRKTFDAELNWNDVDSVALEACHAFIRWINNSRRIRKTIIKSITICADGPDKHVIALQTDFAPASVGEVAA